MFASAAQGGRNKYTAGDILISLIRRAGPMCREVLWRHDWRVIRNSLRHMGPARAISMLLLDRLEVKLFVTHLRLPYYRMVIPDGNSVRNLRNIRTRFGMQTHLATKY